MLVPVTDNRTRPNWRAASASSSHFVAVLQSVTGSPEKRSPYELYLLVVQDFWVEPILPQVSARVSKIRS